MPEAVTDLWARCEPCSRWYACPEGASEPLGSPRCPVCLSQPVAVVDRAALDPVTADPVTAAPVTAAPVTAAPVTTDPVTADHR